MSLPERENEVTTRIYGVAEIAELLSVKVSTVTKWRERELFPEPDHKTARADLWQHDTIEAWARETGRWNTKNSHGILS